MFAHVFPEPAQTNARHWDLNVLVVHREPPEHVATAPQKLVHRAGVGRLVLRIWKVKMEIAYAFLRQETIPARLGNHLLAILLARNAIVLAAVRKLADTTEQIRWNWHGQLVLRVLARRLRHPAHQPGLKHVPPAPALPGKPQQLAPIRAVTRILPPILVAFRIQTTNGRVLQIALLVIIKGRQRVLIRNAEIHTAIQLIARVLRYINAPPALALMEKKQ